MTDRGLLAAVHFAGERATDVARSSPAHGPRHWRDVARLALWITYRRTHADREVLLLFAAMHDTQRLNEYDDPEHGARAAELIPDLPIDLTSEQTDKLSVALRDHDKGGTHEDLTIGTCWDADRLTLGRVGINPHPSYFSTRSVVEDFGRALFVAGTVARASDLTWENLAHVYTDGKEGTSIRGY